MMGKFRKRIIFFLSAALLLSCLSGCQSKAANPSPEEMANALLALTIQNDPSALREALGCKDEAAVAKDFAEVSQRIAVGLHTFLSHPLGQIPEGVILPFQYTDEAALTALSKLTFTVEVTTSEDDRAVLTFSTRTYDPGPLADGLAAWLFTSQSQLSAEDPDFLDNLNGVNGAEKQTAAYQFYLDREYALMAEILQSLEPSDDTAQFQAVFVPTEISVNGRSQTLWLPEDPQDFGATIFYAVFKGL